MKPIAIITAAASFFVISPVFAGGYCPLVKATHASSASSSATRSQARLLIEGMSSASCPLLVKAALAKLDGVADIAVDEPNKIVTVTYDSRVVSLRQIQATIKEKAGFDSTPLG
jgi:copper chaperone CopZ